MEKLLAAVKAVIALDENEWFMSADLGILHDQPEFAALLEAVAEAEANNV